MWDGRVCNGAQVKGMGHSEALCSIGALTGALAQGLNVNRGQVIKLRLRDASGGSFLHYEQV